MSSVAWPEKLRRLFARNRGARLGEATVVSRLVHSRDQSRPHGVLLLMGADAGQTFYGRATPGELIHLDVWHQVGEVEHRQVAGALKAALGHMTAPDGRPLLDLFDLQTGTGGGRITGALTGGQKESLRRNHLNHVHLAGLLPDEQLYLLGPIVSAVEEAILAAGLQLRKIERIAHLRTGLAAEADLSPYTDETADSLLKGARTGAGQPGAPRSESAAPGGGTLAEGPSSADLDQALSIAQRVGSPEELLRLLQEGDRPEGWSLRRRLDGVQAMHQLRALEEGGYLTQSLRGPLLTEEGRQLLHLLECHLRAIKQRFRRLVRRAPATGRPRPALTTGEPSPAVRTGPSRGAAPAQPGQPLGEIAVVETLRRAVTRAHLEALGRESRPHLTLARGDLWLQRRASERPLQICLLIDASASMAGQRIQAAKQLVRHLRVTTQDRLAVISFHEREVRVHVPFTRDWAAVEAGLGAIQPMGLTPLAHGLAEALALITRSRARRPLLLLITDGIPTVAKWGLDPLADGLKAARALAKAAVPFGCIGLQPARRYLTDLCTAAGGALHVVNELDAAALISIAHQERRKLARRLRQGMGLRRAKTS